MKRSSKPPVTRRVSRKARTNQNLADAQSQIAYASALFLSIGDGAIATDKEGKISKINETALQILGYTREEVVGEWFQKVVKAVDKRGNEINPMNRPITKAIISGEPLTQRMFYRSNHDRIIPVTVTVSPILVKGIPVGAVEVFRDITHEIEIENMKSEFISLASHQLRTPLTAITTYTHMLEQGFKGPVSDEQREFLETILASADRMNELIDTLLNVSRLEAGYVKVDIKRTNVNKVLEDALHELWPLSKAKQQKLDIKLPETAVQIQTDPLLLTELCTNLISNAIKYTPAKGNIDISLENNNKYIRIEVADDGYGIPVELQSRIFTKFFRAPNILSQDTGGTGLGLYMAKEIANHLQGNISFESAENSGSTFSLKLPKQPEIQQVAAA